MAEKTGSCISEAVFTASGVIATVFVPFAAWFCREMKFLSPDYLNALVAAPMFTSWVVQNARGPGP